MAMPVMELNSLFRTTFLMHSSLGEKKKQQNCLIATLGDLQSHPEVEMSYEHYFIR